MLAAACAVGVGCCFAAPIGGRQSAQLPIPALGLTSFALSESRCQVVLSLPPEQVSSSALRSPPRSSPCGTTGGASLLPPLVPSSSGSWLFGTVMKVRGHGGERSS